MKKRFVAFLLVLIMVLGMLPVSAMAAGSVVTARGSAENPIRIYENSGNQAETSYGSVQVPVGETVTDSGQLTFSTYSAIEGVQVSTGGFTYCNVTSSNENVVKATGSWSGGVLTINFQGVGNGTAKITVDYTCTCSKGAAANGYLIYNVTVGDGGTTDPSGKPNAPTASDIGAFPDAGKAVLLHCVDAGARGHDATASSLNKVQNGYSVGEVVENPGTYYNVDGGKITKEQFPWMCVVTVHAAPFIELYNSNFSESKGVHKLAGTSNATATLHWFWHNTYGWQYLENPPIQFNITKDTSEKTYTLTYYKNTTDTVTNMPDPNPQTETSNTGKVTFPISNARPVREGYNFLGWAGKQDATEPSVKPGNTVTTTATTTKLYAVWQSNTPPTKPIITGRQEYIRVICKNEPKFGRYTESDPAVQKVNGVWTYTITILRDKHVEEFNKDFPGHEDTDPNAVTTMSWVWKDAEWKLVPVNGLSKVGAIIEVTCKPEAPTADELKKLEMAVLVKCVVDDSQQHTQDYGLLGEYDKDYFVGEPKKVGDDWLCDISYDPDPYVAEFNNTFPNPKHVQNDEKIVPVTLIWVGGSWQLKTQGRVHVTEVYTVTYTDGVENEEVFADQVYSDLRKDSTTPAFNGTPTRTGYTFAGWEPEVAATVTQTVTYVAKWTPVKPEAPSADELKKLEMAVLVKCVVDDSQQHTEAYGLLGECDEDYFVGEPRKDGDDWLCDISYYPERYVAAFNTTFQNLKHVQNDEKIVPVTLIWAGDSWQIKEQGRVPVTEVYTVTYTDGVENEEVFADQVYSDLRKDSTTPAFNGTPTRTGYTFAGWEPEVAATVTQTVTYVAKWEKKTYKVVAKLYVNGKPAYYQNEDFYTYKVSGLYGENIDFDTIKAEAVEQAKQIKKASASYTAVILEDHEPNPVCTTFGEHQPGQATHYVKVNVKTEENVVIFQSFEGKTDLTKLHTTTAPYGTNVVEFLNGLGLDLDVAGYTLDTAEDGNTNWYKKDSPKWTFGANDTINGWTNVLLKYTVTPHNIYAYLRTGDSIGDVLELNEATLNRLGLTKYNTEGFISIGTFVSNTLLTQDEYYGFDEDEAFLDVLAELQTKLVPETGVSLDKVGSKINWSWLYQPSDVDDRIAGYPTEDTDGYQLSGSLLLYGAKFEAGANDVTGMPTAAYGAYLDYFVSGESFNLPAAPTRPGYDFKGWKIGNAVLTAGAAYTVDEDDMVFTAQWEARTDTPYTVEHYLENLDGSYALDTTEPLKGTTDTTVTAAAKSYDNFTYDSTVPDTVASGNIAGDGSLVLKLFYTRNTYDYTVRHIKQLPDGSYDEANAEVETLSGKFEALAAVTAKDYGSHYPKNDADTKQNIKIEKGLTIDVKYDLDEHTLTFETNGGSAINPITVRHGNAVARPADPTKDKYTFIGWYADPEFTEEYDFATVLEADKTIYAKFELTSTPIGDIYVRYDVLHIKQLPDGTYDLANAEVEHLSAKKDTTVTAVIKDYRATHHVNVNRTLSKLTGTAIQPYMGVDGKPVYTILSVYYDLDFHTLTFDTMGGSKIAPETVRHGLTVAKPKDPVNGGYIFDGWYTDKTYRTPYNFATPLTQDTTIYAKWFLIVLPGVTVKKNTPKLNTADHFAYVQGYPDGTVKPAGNITRAETAAILFRLMDDTSRNNYYSTKSGFRDVASGSWYNTYVATLNNAGVITDSSNGYFRPNEAITRAELAAMLAKFSDTTGAANYFNDVSASYWAANAIAICAKLGWITGYPDGTFRPDKNVTRAELMAMINRATGRAPKSADAFLPGMKTWIDNTSDKWYYLDVQEATNSHSYTVKGSETWTALNADPNWSLYE